MFPKPVAGQVTSYAYLWRSEHLGGQEEGLKDRPCAVILVITTEGGEERVTVLPITHTPPARPELAIEIPAITKRRIGLDDDRSWVVLTEANRFTWPPGQTSAQPGAVKLQQYYMANCRAIFCSKFATHSLRCKGNKLR